ncbi:MAG: hypothetical protein COY58_03205 [Gammaproteobacteria bacterium CG_4_10_14_0_8_um_filter_38_16]|nr:MAG: hypothetical protein COY58_03205 [Gammaproteobacteria bacterium CG_4_10_14_0_8_um_filter_38_16]PJA03933.1 MAG: hypothetical protein COX72_03365 [Gammaproteobacteria bacterium CG_4_10_14_0_2_um_filter_38_22]PJB09740.1 MAG: hypothetical protein CO120_08525 [Gammaproteobacteria bacterium CG_4_9_14_3_um_filter_38_9]
MSINLLPWRHEKSICAFQKSQLRILFYIALCFIFIILLKIYLLRDEKIMGLKNIALQKKTDQIVLSADNQNNTLLLNKIKLLYSKKKKAIYKNKHIETLLQSIANDLPPSVTLESLALTQHQLKIKGVSSNLADITHYSNALLLNKVGKSATTPNIHNDPQHPSDLFFTLEVVL